MLFNSFSYLLFLPLVLGLYWCMPVRFRKVFLLAASYFFYMSWKPAYGLLILGLTAVNYSFGLLLARYSPGTTAVETPNMTASKAAKAVLIAGLIFNLGALCYFKYTNFVFESLFTSLGLFVSMTHTALPFNWQQPVLHILLPLGISFFTFEFIHYIVDVYRGSKPVKNFVDFALFASFFPSQIAGPIKRFQDFMQQMDTCPPFKSEQFRAGTYLILQGLFKKVVLGDNIAPIVASGFASAASLSMVDAWITVIGFSYQLYFDFSGYTDIGRGSALLLGYKVPENFNLPFLAANLSDFWRRWHISLSSWLRDYLFIPLGGSRGSNAKTKRNLIITMLLGGLWHGAAWHFVAWGAFHGAGLTLLRDWQALIARLPLLTAWQKHRAWHVAGVVWTNIFVYLAFAVFRAANLTQASDLISRFFGLASASIGQGLNAHWLHTWTASGTNNVSTALAQSPLTVAIPAYFLFFLCRIALDKIHQPNEQQPALLHSWLNFWDSNLAARVVTYATVFVGIIGFAPSQFSPFIYFQF
jgi:alginate O-acetyltransferase complex protein AlgI